MGPTGSVQLGNKGIVKFAAISINKSDFNATFNHRSRAWIVAWKWSEGRAPDALDNRVAEYPVGGRDPERLRPGVPHMDEQWLACAIQRDRTWIPLKG